MSTNFQANWAFSPSVTLTLNIGSTGRHTTLSGTIFPSWRAWKEFLTHNESQLAIKDEYGTSFTVAELITEFESTTVESRGGHYHFLETSTLPEYQEMAKGTDRTQKNACWLDEDGFSVWNIDFS